jgi:hypothetical protein
MKALPRSISLLFAWSVSMFVAGVPGAAIAQNRLVFKSLVDLDKCAANNSDNTGICLEALQQYAKTHPKELFAIGKRARLHFKQWVALEFFEPALGTSPSAAKCADKDLHLAIVSGLSMSADAAPNKIARRLLSGRCFASLKNVVAAEIASDNGEGYVREHACPIFAEKGMKLDACEPKKAVATVPTVEEKLPLVNIATAKVGIIKVYSGSEGERIMMADVLGTPGVYLVRIDGVRSSINGKTMVHKEQQSGNASTYWTEINGNRWNTIVLRSGSYYKNYVVNIPGLREAIGMSYNERESKTATVDSFRK